jgi:hypothetical protein
VILPCSPEALNRNLTELDTCRRYMDESYPRLPGSAAGEAGDRFVGNESYSSNGDQHGIYTEPIKPFGNDYTQCCELASGTRKALLCR